MADDALGNCVGVFAKYFLWVFCEAFDEGVAVHDVGFHEDDGALVEAIGEEVTGPEVRMLINVL